MGVLVIESQKDKNPRRRRAGHGDRRERRWESAEKGGRLGFMSVRDCESKTVEKTGPNVGVLVVQYLKGKTLGRWLVAPGGRKVRSGSKGSSSNSC